MTDKDADFDILRERQVRDLKEQKDQHNLEVNEIEQKLQKERIQVANAKSQQLKK